MLIVNSDDNGTQNCSCQTILQGYKDLKKKNNLFFDFYELKSKPFNRLFRLTIDGITAKLEKLTYFFFFLIIQDEEIYVFICH